ncbi:hypothetical protein [Kutzneria chonburiensis]|uniref:Transporter n=1 Tax=Kutzneria chonburiensis TaxID=1483604 RepID=A0ABV6MVG9_9PSEU|nr:hypothetical protein [Kutzneria chonburiensis]
MIWLTWRQHRVALIGVAAFAVGLASWLASYLGSVQEVNTACGQHECWGGTVAVLGDQVWQIDIVLLFFSPVLAGLVAVFWGAPLLSREYEQRTYLVAWGQDVSPARWLGGRAALLTGAVLLLSVPLAIISWLLVEAVRISGARGSTGPYQTLDLWPAIPVVQALFGLALGVAIGALLRRTLVAMGATLAVYAVVRLTISSTVLWWLPPQRQVYPIGQPSPLPADAAMVRTGLLDDAGNPVVPAVGCDQQCFAERGIRHGYLDVQPLDRLELLTWMEVIAYGLMALGLAWLAWARVRRTTRVG